MLNNTYKGKAMTVMSDRFEVLCYDGESTDTFTIKIEGLNIEPYQATIPAILMPVLTGECGEPTEFVGKTYAIEMPC